MVAYQGNNSANICITSSACGTFPSNEFIVAWSGSPFGNSNLDYNDFAAMAESVRPVPEPDDLALFGPGVPLQGGVIAIEKCRARRVSLVQPLRARPRNNDSSAGRQRRGDWFPASRGSARADFGATRRRRRLGTQPAFHFADRVP